MRTASGLNSLYALDGKRSILNKEFLILTRENIVRNNSWEERKSSGDLSESKKTIGSKRSTVPILY